MRNSAWLGGSELRQLVAERADGVGFGKVVRVHRQHRLPLSWALICAGAVLLCTVVTIVLSIDGSPLWRVPVLLVAGCFVTLAVLMHTGAGPSQEGRFWYAVTEKGLLCWQRDVTMARAVPWSEIEVRRVPFGAGPGFLRWANPERGGRMPVVHVCGTRDLVRAARRGRPGPAWTVRRALGLATGGLVVAAVLWSVGVPLGSYLVLGERPTQLGDFARLCNGGRAYSGTAAYGGPGPHPLALYENLAVGSPDYVDSPGYTSAGVSDSEPDTVQLVGCSHPVGRASQKPLQICPYGDGSYTTSTYQGLWQVDVYQAKTGTKVASRRVPGNLHTDTCSPVIPLPSAKDTETDTSPDDSAYSRALSSLVGGE